MIFFYRLLGLVVWIGLGLTGMMFFALVSYLSSHQGLTLTLAGVTGIIVSVGVTVDSLCRVLRAIEGRGAHRQDGALVARHRASARAFRTIVAADLVSLIGAVVLYVFATSSVRGFAFFLGLSTAIDLILAYCFMHPFVSVLARRPTLVRMPGVGIGAGARRAGGARRDRPPPPPPRRGRGHPRRHPPPPAVRLLPRAHELPVHQAQPALG